MEVTSDHVLHGWSGNTGNCEIRPLWLRCSRL